MFKRHRMKDSLPTMWPSNPQSKTKTQAETGSHVLSSQLLSMAVKTQPASLADSPRFMSRSLFRHGRPCGDAGAPHRLKTQDCGPPEEKLGVGRAPGDTASSDAALWASFGSWSFLEDYLLQPLFVLDWEDPFISSATLLISCSLLKILCLFLFLLFLMELSTVFIYFIGFFPSKICLWVYDSITFLFQLLPVYFSNSFLLVFFCFKICFLAYHIKNQLYVHLFSPKYSYFKICFLNLYFVFNLILYFNHIP